MKLSYTMRWPAPEPVPIQPCCGLRHGLPHQHRKWFSVTLRGKQTMRPYYVDAKGKKHEVLECSRCYRTLAERGLRPANIRWLKAPDDAYCETCTEEMKAGIGAEDASGVFDRVQAGLPLWARGS